MDYVSRFRTIRHEDVIKMERVGMSDAQIAGYYGMSRMGFSKIRRSMSWERKYRGYRSDRGIKRVDAEEQRKRWNAYMRNYYHRNKDKCNHPTIRIGKEFMKESRYKAALLLDRALREEEVVHHIDGDVRNNGFDNLMVFANQGDHLAFHRGEDVEPLYKPEKK